MAPRTVVCLLASITTQAVGISWRAPVPTYVDGSIDVLEAKNAEQVVASLTEKTESAVSSAQASANRAAAAMLSAQDLSQQGQMRLAEMKDMLRGATVAGENAATASEQATASLAHMKVFAAHATEDSKSLAVSAVQRMLAAKFHQLDGWRKSVLVDPFENGQSARMAAVAENDAKLHKLYADISMYQPGIQPMQREAKTLIDNAGILAKEAKVKYPTDPYGALQDMRTARQMQAQGGELAKTAEALHDKVVSWQAQIKAVNGERNPNALAAELSANPNALPPQVVNPNFAYAPLPLSR